MNKLKKWFIKELNIFKKEFTSDKPSEVIHKYVLILVGALFVAITDAFFLIPMNIITGGATSLSIIFHSIPALSSISTTTYVIIFNWIFFIIGLFALGLEYSVKTLVYTIVYPLLVLLFTHLIDITIIDGVKILDMREVADIVVNDNFIIGNESLKGISYSISAIFGGLLLGAGIGFCFNGGGSSGGTDVLNLMMHKYFKINAGTASLITDSTIILIGFFVNGHNLLASLLGVLAAVFCSIMIDKLFLGSSQYFMALVVSTKSKEINEFVISNLDRTTTLVKAEGGYSKEKFDMLECCFERRDYRNFVDSIRRIDPDAFITICKTQEILGYGFSYNEKAKAIPASDARELLSEMNKK